MHRKPPHQGPQGGQLPLVGPHAPHGARPRARRGALTPVLVLLALLWIAAAPFVIRRRQQARIAGGTSCKARLAALGVDIEPAAWGLDDPRPARRAAARRHAVYASMARGLIESGLRLGGEITQGLSQAELFEVPDAAAAAAPRGRVPPRLGGGPGAAGGRAAAGDGVAHVTPKLRPLATPVRAVVLPLLDHEAASQVHEAAAARLRGLLWEGSVYWQNPSLLHATVYHASTHASPVPASTEEVAAEAAAVARVASAACPVHAVLERVVATAGGVLVACWQVAPGFGEPEDLRAGLRHALPRAPPPGRQVIRDAAILHTTIARLVAPARRPLDVGAAADATRDVAPGGGRRAAAGGGRGGGGGGAGEEVAAGVLAREMAAAAEALTDELCGLSAVFDELWYVEELDLLALALRGRYKKRASVLRCREAPAAALAGGTAGGGGGGGGGGGARPRDHRKRARRRLAA